MHWIPKLVWFFGIACYVVISACPTVAGQETPYSGSVHLRGSLDNSRSNFERTGTGRVAFMGGSITETSGFRIMVADDLKRRFPKTKFTFENCGVASTCSTTGAFRLGHDLLSSRPIDLLFVEFAVNDDQDAHHTRAECIRGMEGLVRHARLRNPNTDIVITYFVNPEMLQLEQTGKTPLPIAAHEEVAQHYGISSIDVAKEVAAEIATGTTTWEIYGGTHPAPAGHALCAKMIDSLLEKAWASPVKPDATVAAHLLPSKLLDKLSYIHGRFIDVTEARLLTGWIIGIPPWSRVPGALRDRFASSVMLCAEQPGSQLSLRFHGTAVGAYVLAGPDAGIVETSIDGGPFQQIELYHQFSSGLHYPRTVLFGSELKDRNHTLTLRISSQTHSSGHAVRILHFVAN